MDSKNSYTYAVLSEANGKSGETSYTFIRYEGNEEALAHLNKQIERVDFYMLGDLSVFFLDMENRVSEQTAKEMTLLRINSELGHRKFDGKLQMIDFGIRSKHSNKKRIVRFFETIGLGDIDQYLDGQDISPEDLEEQDQSEDDEGDDGTEYEYDDSSESEEDEKEDERRPAEKLQDKIKKLKLKRRRM